MNFKLFIKDVHFFINLIKFIEEKDILLLNKIDKRKKIDMIEKIAKLPLKNKKNQKEIITIFCEQNYITNNILKRFIKETDNPKNLGLLTLSNYQKYLIDKVVYLNYPYVFKKVIEYIKHNDHLKNYSQDIENRTISMLITSIIKYDINSNNKFITYLYYWIRHGIKEEVAIINKFTDKKNNIEKNRFTISDFQDKQLKNLLSYSMNIKEKEKIKILLNKSFTKKIDNMHQLDLNVFELFNINEKE